MTSFMADLDEKPQLKKRKKPVKHEAKFQVLFSRGFKDYTFAYHKISDQSNDTKPFDCFGQFDGIAFCMELKTHTKTTAFPFSEIRPHQYTNLLEFSKNGAYGVIVIEIKNNKDHFVVFEEIEEFVKRKNTSKRKSIPYEELKKMQRLEIGKTNNLTDFNGKFVKCVKLMPMFNDADLKIRL